MVSESASIRAIDLTRVTLKNGQWYAFRLQEREFFARVYNDAATGFLELTKIPSKNWDTK